MVLIVSGGDINDELLSKYILGEYGPVDAIFAADSGVEALLRIGTKPDYLIGDFDSFSGDIEALLNDPDIVVKRLNPVKDDTDTEAAIRWAMDVIKSSLNVGDITILGSTGKRIDHLLANISILGIPMRDGVNACLVDDYNRIRLISYARPLIIKKGEFGKYVSVFPWAGPVTGLILSGFKYPLMGNTLYGFNSLGVSNEIVADEATITFSDGHLVVVESRD